MEHPAAAEQSSTAQQSSSDHFCWHEQKTEKRWTNVLDKQNPRIFVFAMFDHYFLAY
jgi:hypothetical protein